MKLIGKEAMKDVDARLIKDMGFPETVLIENAGRAVAEEACAFLGGAARKRIVLLCGKGNNGGDGLVIGVANGGTKAVEIGRAHV